jgi:hypothetical protein
VPVAGERVLRHRGHPLTLRSSMESRVHAHSIARAFDKHERHAVGRSALIPTATDLSDRGHGRALPGRPPARAGQQGAGHDRPGSPAAAREAGVPAPGGPSQRGSHADMPGSPPPADLDLRLVRYFTAVASHRHLGRATELRAAQPTRITIGYTTGLIVTQAVRLLRRRHPDADVQALHLDWNQPREAMLGHRMDAVATRLPDAAWNAYWRIDPRPDGSPAPCGPLDE